MPNSDDTVALRPPRDVPSEPTIQADGAPTERVADLEEGGDPTAMFRTGGFTDRYRRGPVLGVGGMGEVRLYDDLATGRAVAMKVIRGGEAAAAARRFAREARIQAQLEHPAIVPVYDLGLDGDGALYFTMKRVRGESLGSVMAALRAGDAEVARRYSTRKLLGVLATVAMAIEYAHSRGVIHRDLKPANVMLGPFGEVYTLDWGLSDVVGGAEVTETSEAAPDAPVPLVDSSLRPHTNTGTLLGTPGYLAPEQVRAGGGCIDRRSDVYALGVMLFELLAQRKLHIGTTLADMLLSTLSVDGASPLERAPGCGAPPELDALCRRATRRDPEHRLPAAASFARAIEDYLDGNRDLERRRELAAESAAAAAAALDRAGAPGADASGERDHAMRQVTAALALDADNAAARTMLVRLLTEPSAAAERAATAMGRAAERRSFQIAARNAAIAHLTYAGYLPFVLWMGVRHWWMLGAMAAAITAVTGLSYYYYRRPPRDARLPLPMLVASALALTSGFVLVGPLMLLPAIAIGTGVAYVSTVGTRHVTVTVLIVLVILGPLVLGLAGVLPPSYAFEGGELHILPIMIALPPVPTMAFLVVTHLVVIVTAHVFVSRLRRDYRESERRLRMQAWQLAQLLPSDARPPLAGADPA